MAFLDFSRTDIQHGLSWLFLANKKGVMGIFIFFLLVMMLVMMLAMMIAPLCYSSTLIDRHQPDGDRVRLEINDGRVRNNTLPLTGGKLAGDVDFPGVGNRGFFYLPPPPWGGGRPSGLFDIDLVILQPVISWLMSTDSALKAADGNGEPSGRAPDNKPEGENDHNQEQSDESEGQENPPPEESDEGNEEDNRKDDNGEGAENSASPNATTQNLQELANRLIAIIEGYEPPFVAAYKLEVILLELDMPQRLQVLETTGTNVEGHPVTPLEAVLKLPRVFKENSVRNLFIEQVILATSGNRQPFNDPDIWSELQPIDRAMPEASSNDLRILHKIVRNIIQKANQSEQQPPIGQFEKMCLTEYFARLFLIYSNPLGLIDNLLGEISEVTIRYAVIMNTESLTLPSRFLDGFLRFHRHPSFDKLQYFKNKLFYQAALSSPLVSDHSDAPDPANDRYLQQGARPKQPSPANRSDLTEPPYNDHVEPPLPLPPTPPPIQVSPARLSVDDIIYLKPPPLSLSPPSGSPSVERIIHGKYQQMGVANLPIPDNGAISCLDHQESGSNEQAVQQPVQETPEPLCVHYDRLCYVSFQCCNTFFPCHKCHNEKVDLKEITCKTKKQAKDATMLKCSLCDYEGEINEGSQTCPNCKKQMSEYHCAICKHFTSRAKDPHHCDKCGICRTKLDNSFHCDVCNVCLDIRLLGNHKCRPDSGHDECAICLEDVFSGGQIFPCSHKVHNDCALKMIQNRITTCPICRHPVRLLKAENDD
ncbi:CHY zinc finger protein [Endozoicomonas sp. 4G]|uniref:RING finger and CHY zinc finger domain-containing protein n=1 Tax=Endozoicomonas sp. 4G TaxID=2872754 RepID=UPI0020786BEE|nr:CHY zinc finger protein [Endozoicomonas sp. 4G]